MICPLADSCKTRKTEGCRLFLHEKYWRLCEREKRRDTTINAIFVGLLTLIILLGILLLTQ